MITIRYAELPEGLHAKAETRGRRTVIYLRPGLTPEQRRWGLRRARQSARMGYGPRLPAAGVALAVAGDTIRGVLRDAAAAVRAHPLGSAALAGTLAASLICYTVFVTGSLTLIVPNSPWHSLFPPSRAMVAPPGHVQHPAVPGARGHGPAAAGGGPRHARQPAATPRPRRASEPSPTPAPSSPGPTRSPDPLSTSPVTSKAPPPPSASPAPASPTPSPRPSGLCVILVCLP